MATIVKDLSKLAGSITIKELEESHGGNAASKFGTLEQLGLLQKLGNGTWVFPYMYRLHPMLRGLTAEQIDMICGLELEIEGSPVKILDKSTIETDLMPIVQAKVIEMVQNIIHDKNLELRPAIEEKKVLWHVFVNELIPDEQQAMGLVTKINQISCHLNGPERIRILNKKERLTDVLAELAADDNNNVNVLLNDGDRVDEITSKNVKIAILSGTLGNYAQLEGAMAVSRALNIKDPNLRNQALRSLHKLLTGEEFKGTIPDTDDPCKIALAIIFTLPKINVMDHNELKTLNENITFLIKFA